MSDYDPIIPPLRYELSLHQPDVPGPLIIQDPKGYLPDHFALKEEVLPYLRFFDGTKSLSSMIFAFSEQEGIDAFCRSLISQLDEALLLDSHHFKIESESIDQDFENRDHLNSIFSGSSYPEDPQDWPTYFNLGSPNATITPPKGNKPLLLFAPHIDFRIERKLYTEAFSQLKGHKFKRILAIATSHYAGYYPEVYQNHPFICSTKDFISAYGKLDNDHAFSSYLAAKACDDKYGLSFQDRAFRTEHALEYHLILSQLFLGNEPSFLPVLVGGLNDMLYAEEGFQAQQLENFSQLVASYLNENDLSETLILVSGDLAHVGPRFGGSTDADLLKNKIQTTDDAFLKGIQNAKGREAYKAIQSEYDKYNHCGYPPVMLALKILEKLNTETTGKRLGYSAWYDKTDQSTVSYGAVLLNKI